MKLPKLPLIPNASALLGDSSRRATVEWYNYWRKLGDVMRRSLEAEARDYQLKAAALDPRAYVFGETASASLTVPPGKVWLVTNLYRIRFAGLTAEAFMRKPDARDVLVLPAGTVLSHTPFHAAVQYCDPGRVIDPASADYDARYTDDPKGLYFERLTKLETIPLRTTEATIAQGTSPIAQAETGLDWGTLTEQWGILRYVGVENGSWMLATNAAGTMGINLTPEISDLHAHRLQSYPILMPFLKEQFAKIQLRGGSWHGDPAAVPPGGSQTDTASGVLAWSALDENSW